MYESIEASLDGLKDLGPVLATKTPRTRPEYAKVLKNPLKQGNKLNTTQLRELIRCFDGTGVDTTVTLPELVGIITNTLVRLQPTACTGCMNPDLALATRLLDPRPSCVVCRRDICQTCQTTQISEQEKEDKTVIRICRTCKVRVIETMSRYNCDS